jgi:membrane-associated phospholipid phosphatase
MAAEQPPGDAPQSKIENRKSKIEERSLAGGVRQALALAGIMLGSLSLYLVVLKWRGPAARLTTHLPPDDWLPFRPEWVWVYLIPYLVGPALVGFLRPSTFRWYVGRGLVVVATTLLIFIAVPTRTAPRPPSEGLLGGLTAFAYHNMVEIDEPPANAAPSLHVSLTCLLAWALCRDFPRWWAPAWLGTGLVWLATLLTRQHHLLDIVSGALLAAAVVWLWPRRKVTR